MTGLRVQYCYCILKLSRSATNACRPSAMPSAAFETRILPREDFLESTLTFANSRLPRRRDWLLDYCEFNRSLQHLSSDYRAVGAVDGVFKEDLLHAGAEVPDVGPLASWRLDI